MYLLNMHYTEQNKFYVQLIKYEYMIYLNELESCTVTNLFEYPVHNG